MSTRIEPFPAPLAEQSESDGGRQNKNRRRKLGAVAFGARYHQINGRRWHNMRQRLSFFAFL